MSTWKLLRYDSCVQVQTLEDADSLFLESQGDSSILNTSQFSGL